MAEEAPPPLYVTQTELEEEKASISKIENRLTEIDREWDSFAAAHPGLVVVSPTEYRREAGVIGSAKVQLREIWSEWSRYMTLTGRARREAAQARLRSFLPTVTFGARELRRRDAELADRRERDVARYLSYLKGIRRDIRRIEEELKTERAAYQRKVRAPPEILAGQAERESLEAKLEAERERLGRKVVGYLRTQYAEMYYVETPGSKTPDPIAEFRVTGVSDEPGHFKIEEFRKRRGGVLFHMGMIHSMTAPWKMMFREWLDLVEFKITAFEEDEVIDPDELATSVPVYARLNYAERYSIWYRSRRGQKWPYDYAPKPVLKGTPHDYEYDEKWYKATEEGLIARGRLRTRFDNIKGRIVPAVPRASAEEEEGMP